MSEHLDTLGIYLRDAQHSKPLTRDEEAEVWQQIAAGSEEARERLAEANLLFVVSVAKQFQGQGLSLPELVSVGNVGLMTAVDRFDASLGFKFISYAVWWIRQGMYQAIADQVRTVRIPVNVQIDAHHIEQEANRQAQVLGRFPSQKRAAEAVGNLTPGQARNAELAHVAESSLDAPMFDDGGDRTELHGISDPEPRLDDDHITEALKDLPARDRTILRRHYGFGGGEPQTLQQIGDSLGLTRERIRQLRNRALGVLRENGVLEELVA
jgi:RNA polymerase primary sigma factor